MGSVICGQPQYQGNILPKLITMLAKIKILYFEWFLNENFMYSLKTDETLSVVEQETCSVHQYGLKYQNKLIGTVFMAVVEYRI